MTETLNVANTNSAKETAQQYLKFFKPLEALELACGAAETFQLALKEAESALSTVRASAREKRDAAFVALRSALRSLPPEGE